MSASFEKIVLAADALVGEHSNSYTVVNVQSMRSTNPLIFSYKAFYRCKSKCGASASIVCELSHAVQPSIRSLRDASGLFTLVVNPHSPECARPVPKRVQLQPSQRAVATDVARLSAAANLRPGNALGAMESLGHDTRGIGSQAVRNRKRGPGKIPRSDREVVDALMLSHPRVAIHGVSSLVSLPATDAGCGVLYVNHANIQSCAGKLHKSVMIDHTFNVVNGHADSTWVAISVALQCEAHHVWPIGAAIVTSKNATLVRATLEAIARHIPYDITDIVTDAGAGSRRHTHRNGPPTWHSSKLLISNTLALYLHNKKDTNCAKGAGQSSINVISTVLAHTAPGNVGLAPLSSDFDLFRHHYAVQFTETLS